jgi:hypothetical protein
VGLERLCLAPFLSALAAPAGTHVEKQQSAAHGRSQGQQ